MAEQFNSISYLEQQIRAALKDYNDFSNENKEANLLNFLNRLGHNFRVLIIAKQAGVPDYEMIYEKLLERVLKLAHSW